MNYFNFLGNIFIGALLCFGIVLTGIAIILSINIFLKYIKEL